MDADPRQFGADPRQVDADLHTPLEETRPIEALRFQALGSDCELYAVAPVEPLEVTAEWVRGLHRRLTRFDPNSELSRFNARAGEWVDVSPDLEALLRVALDAFEESGGLVSAAVLPALIAAGYDRTFSEVEAGVRHRSGDDRHRIGDKVRMPLREDGAPRALAPLPSLLQVRRGRARLGERAAAIDLGGLAKGWIADRAAERLGPNSLANMGGDLRAAGEGPTGEGWPVAFGGRTLLLTDHGAATSGTTMRRWGDGRHHLIDPRTGAPAATDLREVSVLAHSALEAEVLAKTALLLGSARAEDALRGNALAWALS